ncbi:probable rhamnogalacturonate lyase B [Mangifera indica]|uniref:probable rhamnogalacturonate lyase B n=1 Tax=Mangifera indica TaxID=29780 RepID=UPI001CFA63BE|nr:probable rhamnogalacturonate lyase B [Mangifera indica]XP_044488233.1 probable rhamnogalacturonate lyase B [Mangifera indica]
MARWNNVKWSWVFALLAMIIQLHFFTRVCSENLNNPFRKILRNINDRELTATLDVKLNTQNHRQVIMSNGLVQVTLSSPDGEVIGIKYNGIDNVLESENELDNRGYWDVVWYKPGDNGTYDKLEGTNFRVIVADEDQVEVSFSKKWNSSLHRSNVPLNVDKRYIMRRGVSGLYAYAILEREPGWPDVDMDQIRAVFKLQKDKFHYMAISDERQRIMPMPEDRETGQQLAYPEAVLLTKPINPELRGEVDDKYQYSVESKDNKVHGWISSDPPVGFWMITPSSEFRSSGPIKQDLTSHVGPTVLSMFTSTHYGGKVIDTMYRNGEPWKKVMGPVFVYLNQVSTSADIYGDLWEDAKAQMRKEVESWPYDFPQSQDFLKSYQRGNISGQLQVFDRYINSSIIGAKYAYVGLAAPGEVGSWQTETKGYQFWTQTDEEGNFFIKNVREGDYNLYAWVPGFVGDYKHSINITIQAGSEFKLGAIVYWPPRIGPTLWEIGVPDRSAAEFYVPDPYPTLMNRLYTNQVTDKFRQYGLWEQYADIYRNEDLKYTLGVSDYTQDWFFAHVTRDIGNRTYEATTWQIMFELPYVDNQGNYTLQVALASATDSELQVRFNDANVQKPHFTTGSVGKDNAIARHGIHGLYRFYSINVPSDKLYRGNNTIYLTQSRSRSPFQGILYDYIRLEGPPGRET